MSLEYQLKKPEDLTKINSNDLGELLWWSYMLNASPEEILSVIDKVGVATDLIKKRIKLELELKTFKVILKETGTPTDLTNI